MFSSQKYNGYGLKIENWYKNVCSNLSLECLSFYDKVKDEAKQTQT